jgi:hypothetical protein
MYKAFEDNVTIDCWEHHESKNHKCHPAWIKMMDSIDDNLPIEEFERSIDSIMCRYHAKMIRPNSHPHYMRFPNEKMAAWFLLEWS